MNISIRHRRGPRAMTLVEVLIAASLAAVAMSLLYRAFVDLHRFYGTISEQSREGSVATIFLDQFEAASYGLPRQALSIDTSNVGRERLVLQPMKTLAPSGAAVYSDKRRVFENGPLGVRIWDIDSESSELGSGLSAFPPVPAQSRSRIALGPNWTFHAEFDNGSFPLTIELASPKGSGSFRRVIEGYL